MDWSSTVVFNALIYHKVDGYIIVNKICNQEKTNEENPRMKKINYQRPKNAKSEVNDRR